MEDKIAPSTKKILVKAHAKYLMSVGEAAVASKKEAIQEKDSAAATQGKKGTSSVQLDSLYDLLYDQNGVSKSANLNQKVVINGPTLELLDSKGNAISFQPVGEAEA